MKRFFIAVLAGVLLAVMALPVDLELTVTKKTPLKGEVGDLVTFGLLKEMTCDAEGNIFSPSNRKYGSAINAIVRFPHDASSFTAFSIDSATGVKDGTITDFDVEPNGELFVLAREVLKYSNVEVPVEFGRTFILRFSQDGRMLFRRGIELDTEHFSPTGFVLLQGGEFLVVGYRNDKEKTVITIEIVRSEGTLRTRFDLNPEGTKTSRQKTVESPRVFHPEAMRANGRIYVLRGTTTEPVYELSESGQLLRAIRLSPPDLEFDSPKFLGGELIVRQHPVPPIHLTDRLDLPVFSLETGEIVNRYVWHNQTVVLACATAQSATLIGQDISSPNPDWVIFETRPSFVKTKDSATGR